MPKTPNQTGKRSPAGKTSTTRRTEKGRTITTATQTFPKGKVVRSTTTTPLGGGRSNVSVTARNTTGTQARRGGNVGGDQSGYSFNYTPKKGAAPKTGRK